MITVPVATSLVFAAGFAVILLQDYARASRPLIPRSGRRVLRARAQFRPLPLSIPLAAHGVEIRPVSMRLLPEPHRLDV